MKVTDANGNAVAGQSVSFSASNDATIAASGKTDSKGMLVMPVTSMTAGHSTINATVNNSHQTVEVSFIGDESTATLAAGAVTVMNDNAVANGSAANQIQVVVTDAGGNPLAGQNVSFKASLGAHIASSATTGSDGTLQLPITSTFAGVSTVTASINGSSQSVDLTFVPDSSTAQINRLAVVVNNAVADGSAQNQVQVTVTDANNNPLAEQAVSASASDGAQVKASGKTGADGTLKMGITSLKAGISTVTVVVNGQSQSVDVTFVADETTAGIASGNMTVTANNAKANNIATNSVRVVVTDANGNLLAGQRVTFSADNGATMAAQGTSDGAGVVDQTITSTRAGDSQITAKVNGSQQNVTVTFLADGDSAHIASGSLEVTANNAIANGSATNQVQATVVDENDNPVPSATVLFSASNGAAIAAQGTTDNSGNVTTTLTSETAGISKVTATVNGGSQTTEVSFIADSSTATIRTGDLSVIADNAVANGVAANQLQVKVSDANGNPVAGENVDFTASNGATIVRQGSTGKDGFLRVPVTSLKAGKSTIQVTVNNTTLTAAMTFIADAGTAQIADGQLSVVTNNAVANGSDANAVRVQVTDKNGNRVGGQVVSFSASHNATMGASGTTDVDGNLTMPVTSLTAGTSVITASVNGSSQSVDLIFVADADSAQIAANDMTVIVDNAVANGIDANEVQVKITDANGNELGGQTVTLAASAGALIAASAVTAADGTARIPVTSLKAGVSTITATVNGSHQSVAVTFVADSSTAQITQGDMRVVTDNAIANGTAANQVAVRVSDAQGNPISGQMISFSASNGATLAASATSGSDGKVVMDVTSTVAGVSEITATVNGSSQSMDVTFTADTGTAQIADGDLRVVSDNAIANGNLTNIVKARVTDAYGNPLDGQTVSFSVDNGATKSAPELTDSLGEVSLTIANTTAGKTTVTASINNSSQSIAVNFIADSSTAAIASGDMILVSDNAKADGRDPDTVQVTVKDANANLVAEQVVSFTADNNAQVAASGRTDAQGVVTVPVTSIHAGSSTVTATVNGSTQSLIATFVADSTTAQILASDMRVTANGALSDGKAQNQVQVKVTDANGNVIGGAEVAFSATGGAVVTAKATTDDSGTATVPVTTTHSGVSKVTASINGNSQSVEVTFIAATVPVITAVEDDAGTIAGALTSGKVTDDTLPVLSGTADSNATIRLFDSGTLVGTSTANADGQWHVTPGNALTGEGNHTLTVTGALTADGEQSVASDAFILKLDTVAQLPVIERVTDSSGGVAQNGTTNGHGIVLYGTTEPGATVNAYIARLADRTLFSLGSVVADSSGNWQFTVTETGAFQATGGYNFQAKTTDIAGNSSKMSDMDPYAVNYQSWPAPLGTPEYTITGSGEKVSSDQVASLLSGTGNALYRVVASGGYTPTLELPAASAANKGNRVYIAVGSDVRLGVKSNGTGYTTLDAGSNSTWYSDGGRWERIY